MHHARVIDRIVASERVIETFVRRGPLVETLFINPWGRLIDYTPPSAELSAAKQANRKTYSSVLSEVSGILTTLDFYLGTSGEGSSTDSEFTIENCQSHPQSRADLVIIAAGRTPGSA